jgi:hypothetical protein
VREFRADAARQVCLPAGVVGKNVKDAERRRIELHSEPGSGLGLLLDYRLCVSQKLCNFCLFARSCVYPNQQPCSYHHFSFGCAPRSEPASVIA